MLNGNSYDAGTAYCNARAGNTLAPPGNAGNQNYAGNALGTAPGNALRNDPSTAGNNAS